MTRRVIPHTGGWREDPRQQRTYTAPRRPRAWGAFAAVVPVAFALCATCACAQPPAPAWPEAGSWDPVSAYHERRIEGWRVLVSEKLDCDEQRRLCDDTLRLLADHLYRIDQVVPAAALAKLRQIPIWVELAHPRHKCMCYHPSPAWLREHQMNPAKAGAVEIANARTFLQWTHDQPWMVLHELAHAYHHQVVGHDHAALKECFKQAAASQRYEDVLHIRGTRKRHYALTNAQEYFAEGTEAHFGTNDFYPFVRSELREHDPALAALLGRLWGAR